MPLLALVLLVTTATFYLIGVRRLGKRGRAWPMARSAAFAGGIAAVWAAVGSPLAALDDTSVRAHMVQHVLLMMVAPVLLALGEPLALAAQAAGRRNQVRIVRALRSRPVGALTHPIPSWALYFGVMYGFVLDRSVYQFLIGHDLAHYASHAVMVAAGSLYWQPLVGSTAGRRRLSHPFRAVAILLGMPFEAILGILLRSSAHPITPLSTLADTQAAGYLFLVLATLVGSVCMIVVFCQWYRQVVREDRRETARAETAGWKWTVPPWVAEINPGAAGPSPDRPGPPAARSA